MTDLFIFDGHCDTAYALWEQKTRLAHNLGHCDLQRGQTLPGWAQFFAFCPAASLQVGKCSMEQLLLQPYQYFSEQLAQQELSLCTTASEVETALQAGRLAPLFSLEGAEAISCDSGRLELLQQMGFSMVSLTWNGANSLAGSHFGAEGLSAQGKQFVRRAQSLGMIVDVSHISDRAFWDICRITDAPIVASHSNSRSICANSRNLTDDMYRAICASGGTVGINLYAEFLSDDRATFETVWRHVDHFLQLAGTDEHLCLGGDLDGCDALPDGFVGVESYPALLDFFLQQRLHPESIKKIANENLMEVLRICTKKRQS